MTGRFEGACARIADASGGREHCLVARFTEHNADIIAVDVCARTDAGYHGTDFDGRDSATDVTGRPHDTTTRASSIAAASGRNLSRRARRAGPAVGGCERWREDMAARFVPVDIVSTANDYAVTGELMVANVGAISIGGLSSSALDFRRTPANIRRGDMGGVKVSVQLRGRGLIVQNGREAVLNPGDFAVYDTSAPYAMHYASTFETLVLMFPRASLKISSDELTKASAQRIPGDQGIGALVSQFLTALQPRLLTGSLATTPMMEDAILDLISAVAIDNTQFGRIPLRAGLLASARTFIATHLAEPDLDTSKVAAALHISPRYLQKVFEAEGLTVAGWIRSRRLERCRRDLQDARLLGENVSTIAARHGLHNSAHFSRIFKSAYGVSPTAYREGFRA